MNVGAAFGDHIKIGKAHKKHYDPDSSHKMRSYILIFLLLIFPSIILLKLFNIQIVHGGYYKNISDLNRTKTNILHPQRGVIFDRNGVPLVVNTPGFEAINGGSEKKLTREKAIELMVQEPGSLQIKQNRLYPLKEVTAHVLGYTGNISAEELSVSQYGDYALSETIGKSGIEKQYDKLLRGVSGKELVEVDALGNKIRVLGTSDPLPGTDIKLTIDSRLQKVAFDALPSDKKGAVIVSSPNGEILVLVSKPSYDPNLFTIDNYISSESAYRNVTEILNDSENQPLMDRAVSGQYPPGSTFKLITAASGLDNKIIDSRYQVEDTGIIKIGEFSFGNWYFLEKGGKDGKVDVVKGIARSNDIFFYKLAEKITVDKLSKTASEFGVGRKLGVDLPGEREGILPTKKWKSDVIKEPWYLGDTYHYGIGQGYLLTTPLQVNMWTAAIANDGVLPKPHLLKNTSDKVQGASLISKNNIDLIRRGMIESCKPGGVAWPLFQFKVQNSKLKIDNKNFFEVKAGTESASLKDYREVSIACKTGTAQHGGEETLSHAWITLFAPAYDPEIVVTVLVESAGQGSDIAAPVAKKVLEEYFKAKL